MHAILKIAGKQFKVTENKFYFTPKIKGLNENDKVEFDKVLLLEDEKGNIEVGTPILEKVKVTGKILENFKDKKIIVFKKKRRKGYKKLQGHRQSLCKVLIEKITKE